MKPNIAITGSSGQLGSELVRQLGPRAAQWTRRELDFGSDVQIREKLTELRPAVLINCAAYTAVDKAENEADACFRTNAAAVATFADVCREQSIRLVQISTDYIFDSYAGSHLPITEDTAASPQGVYAQSKLQGEFAAVAAPDHLIVRTCGLYGGGPSMRNFVETMLRLAKTNSELRVVNDQHCTPSYCRDVAAAILRLIEADANGVYHVTNSESVTWHQFACEIFSIAGLPTHVAPITTAEYAAPAPRPAYSVLSLQKYRQTTGAEMPAWRDALRRYLHDRRSA